MDKELIPIKIRIKELAEIVVKSDTENLDVLDYLLKIKEIMNVYTTHNK